MRAQFRIRWLVLIFLLQAALATAIFSIYFLNQVLKEAPPISTRRPGEGVPTIVKKFEFRDASSLKAWEEKIFKGKTTYEVVNEEGKSYLDTTSKNSASGLYIKIDLQATPDLYLAWRWKVLTHPVKKEPKRLSNRSEDDFAARVYVIFPGSSFFNTDVIEYIWDDSMQAGSMSASPYSSRVQLYVIRDGGVPVENDGWASEERNPYKDYELLFRKKPTRNIGAIAIMSDSDNTGTESRALFGDLVFKIKKKL